MRTVITQTSSFSSSDLMKMLGRDRIISPAEANYYFPIKNFQNLPNPDEFFVPSAVLDNCFDNNDLKETNYFAVFHSGSSLVEQFNFAKKNGINTILPSDIDSDDFKFYLNIEKPVTPGWHLINFKLLNNVFHSNLSQVKDSVILEALLISLMRDKKNVWLQDECLGETEIEKYNKLTFELKSFKGGMSICFNTFRSFSRETPGVVTEIIC
ncbi:MAG: hypothetical protein MUF50_01740 [Planctomycetes bacterium]|nr:hypothetical protein [Planctomycetota bacterium]